LFFFASECTKPFVGLALRSSNTQAGFKRKEKKGRERGEGWEEGKEGG